MSEEYESDLIALANMKSRAKSKNISRELIIKENPMYLLSHTLSGYTALNEITTTSYRDEFKFTRGMFLQKSNSHHNSEVMDLVPIYNTNALRSAKDALLGRRSIENQNKRLNDGSTSSIRYASSKYRSDFTPSNISTYEEYLYSELDSASVTKYLRIFKLKHIKNNIDRNVRKYLHRNGIGITAILINIIGDNYRKSRATSPTLIKYGILNKPEYVCPKISLSVLVDYFFYNLSQGIYKEQFIDNIHSELLGDTELVNKPITRDIFQGTSQNVGTYGRNIVRKSDIVIYIYISAILNGMVHTDTNIPRDVLTTNIINIYQYIRKTMLQEKE